MLEEIQWLVYPTVLAASSRVSAVSTASGYEPSQASLRLFDSDSVAHIVRHESEALWMKTWDNILSSTMVDSLTPSIFSTYASTVVCAMVDSPSNTQSTVRCLSMEGSRLASIHSKDRTSTHYAQCTGEEVPGDAPLQPEDKHDHLPEHSIEPHLLHGPHCGQDEVNTHPCQQEGHDGGELAAPHGGGDHPHAQDLHSQLELGIQEYSCIQFKASLAYLKLETAVIFLDSLHLQQSLNQQHGVAPRAVCNPWVHRGHHHQLQVVRAGHCLGQRGEKFVMPVKSVSCTYLILKQRRLKSLA